MLSILELIELIGDIKSSPRVHSITLASLAGIHLLFCFPVYEEYLLLCLLEIDFVSQRKQFGHSHCSQHTVIRLKVVQNVNAWKHYINSLLEFEENEPPTSHGVKIPEIDGAKGVK